MLSNKIFTVKLLVVLGGANHDKDYYTYSGAVYDGEYDEASLVPAWKATWKATWQAHLETHLISLPTTLRSLITDYAAPSTVEANYEEEYI